MSIIFWFTQDLRLSNNSGFLAACQKAPRNAENQAKVIPLYIFNDTDPWGVQGAQRWWLHHSLSALQNQLQEKGGKLVLRSGEPLEHFTQLFQQHKIEAVYFARAYDTHNIQLQTKLKALCEANNVECRRFSGVLLQEPEETINGQGLPFKVFTPYSKKFVAQLPTPKLKALPKTLQLAKPSVKSEKLNDWSLCPSQPNWAQHFGDTWQPGEQGAQQQLTSAIKNIVHAYEEQRNLPAIEGTSRLSPYIHFGELSVAKIWHEITRHIPFEEAFPYLRQLIWREFSYSLLFNWPHVPSEPFNPNYEHFPWENNPQHIKAWQQGRTGYPIVDAGMRQLWQTGWMHNRVRMIVASFLTKHLLVHWKVGAEWFWDTLLDADLANNSAGWQWVAGSGADAAPYFRIFNPITQSEKFDASGDYIRHWLPELASLPKKYLHKPWAAPASETNEQVKAYPPPIVDHSEARAGALKAYESIKARR